MLSGNTSTQGQIQVIESRSVLGPTVKKEGLNIIVKGDNLDALSEGGKPPVVVDRLRVPDKWMGEDLTLTAQGGGQYKLASPEGKTVLEGEVGQAASAQDDTVQVLVTRLRVPVGASLTVRRIHDQYAINDLLGRLKVVESGEGSDSDTRQESGIIALTLEGSSPVRLKNTLNALVSQYIKQNIEVQAAQARESLNFIHKQLPEVKKQLDQAQAKLANYSAKNGVVNLDQQAKDLLAKLSTLQSQLTQLQANESSMRQRFTSNYPGLQALHQQEEGLRSQINSVKAEMSSLPSKEKTYVNLLQGVQVSQNLHTNLLAEMQTLRIAEASTIGSARVVDYATTPLDPVRPQKGLVIGLGFVLGLFLGIFIVILRYMLARTIQDPTALEGEFGVPVYATVPHSAAQAKLRKKFKRAGKGRLPVLAIDAPDDPSVQAIRSFRVNLEFALRSKEQRIVAVGGCDSGTGRNFLSVNLAHLIGVGGAKVLLVDGDLWEGGLEKFMGMPKEPGFAEILGSDAGFDEVLSSSPLHDNVDFLSSGRYSSNLYQLFSSTRLEKMMEDFARRYDVVVIAVPPVLSTAEGVFMSRLSAVNFVAVRAGAQTLQETRVALDYLEQAGVHLDGFIFNDLSRRVASYTYGDYYARRYFPSRRRRKS